MPWNPNIVDSQILAIHAALVPSGENGEVVLFGGDEHWEDQQEPDGSFRKTRVYDVQTHQLISSSIPSPDSDVFCSGHAFVGDGRLLIIGGTSVWETGHGHDLDLGGHRRCWLYNAHERNWVEAAQLLPDPHGNGTSGGGRWYPGAVTLANGDVLTLFGHVRTEDTRHRNANPERFDVNTNTWSPMPLLANDGNNYLPNMGNPIVRPLFFARTFQLPDGRLFFATAMPVEWASHTTGTLPATDGPHFSSFFDLTSGAYIGTPIPEAAGYDGWSFPCVLLPLLPEENYHPRVMHCGRASAMRIDLNATVPVWQSVETATKLDRVNSCAVLLPTGQVCLVGGVTNEEHDGGQRMPAELYDPNIDWAAGRYGSGLGTWTVDSGLPVHSRNYHSAALLLPTGAVLTCGGNRDRQMGDPNLVGVKRIELFEPDYAAGTRPIISSAPSSITYGQSFEVTVSNPASISRVALIRNGSCTHAYDFDQRYVGLKFDYHSGDSHVRATTPPNGNVAPPGY
jgi:hypothetical protein